MCGLLKKVVPLSPKYGHLVVDATTMKREYGENP